MEEEKTKRVEKKKIPLTKKQKEVLFGVVSFVGSFLVTAAIILTFAVFIPQGKLNEQKKQYDNAVSLLDNGNYEEAASRFNNMSYGDSKNLYYVALAGQSFNDGDYEAGIQNFHDAGGSVDVHYDPNGGTVSNSREVFGAKRKWINSTPNRSGYDFIEWQLSSFSISYRSNKYSASLNLLADWNIVSYSITYDLNGGSLSDLVNDYNVTTPTFSLGSPTKKGYTFVGWSGTDIDGMSKNVSIEAGSVGNRTYLANYKPNEYLITYDYAYDDLIEEKTVTYDTNYSLVAPSRDGYRFDGWYYNGQKIESGTWSIDTNVTLQAHWTVLTYTITYDLDGGANHPNNPQSFTYFEEVLLKDPEKNGYIFDGWYENNIKVEKIPEGTSRDIVLIAKWIALKNNLVVNCEDDSKGRVSIISGFGFSGEEINVRAAPRSGYSFLGWFSENDGDLFLTASLDYVFIMPSYDYSLIARFIETSSIYLGDTLNYNSGATTYGLYPQTHINDPSLEASLDKELGGSQYGLCIYNNQYFYKSKSSNNGYFDDGTEFIEGTYYWFKCEPIEWVNYTDYDKANVYFTTKKILDARYFDKDDDHIIDYENSGLRSWLTTNFYSDAFWLNDEYIQETEIFNISEKIWIGESLDYTRMGDLKRAYLTDYARTRENIYWVEGTIDDDPTIRYFAPYVTRPRTVTSAYKEGQYIDFDGSSKYTYVSRTYGIRPCVNILITKLDYGLEG